MQYVVVSFVQLYMDSQDDKIKALLWSQEFHFFISWESVELDTIRHDTRCYAKADIS